MSVVPAPHEDRMSWFGYGGNGGAEREEVAQLLRSLESVASERDDALKVTGRRGRMHK